MLRFLQGEVVKEESEDKADIEDSKDINDDDPNLAEDVDQDIDENFNNSPDPVMGEMTASPPLGIRSGTATSVRNKIQSPIMEVIIDIDYNNKRNFEFNLNLMTNNNII